MQTSICSSGSIYLYGGDRLQWRPSRVSGRSGLVDSSSRRRWDVNTSALPQRTLSTSYRFREQRCLVIAQAGKKKGGSRKGRGNSRGGGKFRGKPQKEMQQEEVPTDPLAAMRMFARDEKLMFDPVSPDPDALQITYAYPNTYTVGICSLGYQLVRTKPPHTPRYWCPSTCITVG